MATWMESAFSSEKGIALDFPVSSSSSSSPRLPSRLQKRLLETKTPATVEEIEAKLRHADLRRQQFYEKLSSKARQKKPRSPSRTSCHEEDLGQRLEAKLQAAEQKRLSILTNTQTRLARLDELRQAAKTGLELRFKKESERIGAKMELRVQQAEANRMLILKVYKQRRAMLKERKSQSLLRRIAWESKYKERVYAAIHQKRAAAEKKRLGLLEAGKRRARARVLQALQVVNSVSHQREVERRRMRDQLEDRLQRAKRLRAAYLRQRGRRHNSVQVNTNGIRTQADLLSRKLARCWRWFVRSRRTTLELAKEYDALKVNMNSIKSMPFEQLAYMIESSATLQSLKALLDRLECRYEVSKVVADTNYSLCLDNIDHLLKRVATPKKRMTTRTSMRSRQAKNAETFRDAGSHQPNLLRYPVRIVLCAYMVVGHPNAVFTGQGEREIALAKSAEEFVREFESLIRIIRDGPIKISDEESDSISPKRFTFRSQLASFDKAWCCYLNSFVVWKVKDAQSLEEDLVKAACQLELSMIKYCNLTPGGDNDTLTHDMKAIQKQVSEGQKLLKEKVKHLSGDVGIEHMECALSETRSNYLEAMEKGSPVGSSITHFLTPSIASSPACPSPVSSSEDVTNACEGGEMPDHIVRALFRDVDSSPLRGSGFSSTSNNHLAGQSGCSDEKMITENEFIVNEFLHERHHGIIDVLNATDKDQNSIKAKIRETMEKAFWDSIKDSVRQDDPDYGRVIQLVREVRDEICDLAPESWKQEIVEAIDLDILSQVLRSGKLEVEYLGNMLDFSLGTLQKLSSPAKENEMKIMHQKLLKELIETCHTRDESQYSNAIAMIEGLRFVLEQIQILKQEISMARIKMMEPLLKGPAGLDYLRTAFVNRYGSHVDACTSLPLTMQWLSSVRSCIDQEWEEHKASLSAMMSHEKSSDMFLPSVTLRTGGSFQVKTNGSENLLASALYSEGGRQPEPECSGERIDLLLRLGLLKLVTGVSGLTNSTLPETFALNLSRLQTVQSQIQKIIVISTSILVYRQILTMEQMVANSTNIESLVSECSQKLLEVLDRDDNVGIDEIVEIMSGFAQNSDDITAEKLRSRKIIMARMLLKSLQEGDPVFEKVSRAVYLAARGVVLGGCRPQGMKLAEMALGLVGAAVLTERMVDATKVLVVAATVSLCVHRPWYVKLTENM